MPGRNHLFTPGPTTVPERVRQAMAIPTEDHRGPQVPAFTRGLLADLRQVLRTEAGTVLVFPGSGTGGWEAAISNTLSAGDRVLACRHGQFSHLWIQMCERHGLDVDVVEAEWGMPAPVEAFAEILAEDEGHAIRAVLVTHNETSTGVTSDVAGVRAAMDAASHPALLFVDGVSSIASIDFRMDDWGVDIAVSGSQKGFMTPTGLAIVAASESALAAGKRATLPRSFFDFADMARSNADGWFPYTPAMTLLRGLRAAVDLLLEEGLDAVHARHHHLAEGARAAVNAWGLRQCAQVPVAASDTVTAVVVPEGVDGAAVVRAAFERSDLSLGGGLGQLAGKVFRIGHLGDLDEVSLLGALAGTELALLDAGVDLVPGSGVGAAITAYRTAPGSTTLT